MALTNAERARIRLLGGWGSRWTQTNTRLESSMTSISMSAPDEENLIRDLLAKLDSLDTLITNNLDMVGVKQTGSIILDDTAGVGGVRSEGARIVEAIFALLECEVISNFYKAGSTRGGPLRYG